MTNETEMGNTRTHLQILKNFKFAHNSLILISNPFYYEWDKYLKKLSSCHPNWFFFFLVTVKTIY